MVGVERPYRDSTWVQMERVTVSGNGITVRMPHKPGLLRVWMYEGSLVSELQRLGVQSYA
jgi:hypothetical protein